MRRDESVADEIINGLFNEKNSVLESGVGLSKLCRHCGETKCIDDFYFHNVKSGERQQFCKTCMLKCREERYKKKRDLIIEQVRAWKIQNPDKVKMHMEKRKEKIKAKRLAKKGLVADNELW